MPPHSICAPTKTAHRAERKRFGGYAAATASAVLFSVAALATIVPRMRFNSPHPISIGCTSLTFKRLAVSVPVLSRHNTLTLLNDSMALLCCTSAPYLMMRTAPSA